MNSPMRILILTTTVLVLLLTGCGNRTREALGDADVLYERGKRASDNGNFRDATVYFEQLEARFPFTNAARQGQLDLMYAYYRNREPEAAIDQADQFIRENPAHPRVDYAYYIKGMVHFERQPNFIERWFRADLSQRPPTDARSSFQSFQTLVQRFPESEYAEDARQRMIFLRNRLASYEIYVAEYYLSRGAYIGALNRARYALENYDGAPELRRALIVMVEAYERLGMQQLANDTEKVLLENFANVDQPSPGEEEEKRWWKFW